MPTLNFDIFGRDRGATKALKDVGVQAKLTGTGFSAMQKAAAGAGMTVEQAARRMAAAEMKAADSAGRLRIAQTQLAEVRKKGSASALQLARAEEGVSKAERNLAAAQKDVKKSADVVTKATEEESRSLQRLDKDAGKAHDSLNDLSNRAGLLGAGLLVGVGAVLKSAAGFDKAMSSVAATGGDASKNIEGLRKEAIAMGAATKFSATEAAQGIENLLKAGVSTSDVLSGGLRGALDLAAAGSLEVADAAEIAATAMTQFGLSGAQIPHVADLLAAGAGKAQGEVKDIGDALKMAGLVANQFGVSIEETTGTLAAFASAGLLGSDAGTSFKQMLLQLGAPSSKAADLMEELGIAAYDANGNFVGLSNLAGQLHDKLGPLTQAQRDNALATIFGSDAVRAANVLFKQGAGGIADWTTKVNDAGYAAQVARTKMDNLAGDLETLQGSIETTFIVAGSGANDALRGLTQEATRAVNAFGQIPAPVLETGVKLTALVGIGLLAFAGISKLTIGLSESRKAMANLSEESPRLAKGLSLVGKAAAVATVAVVGLQAWGALSNEIHGKFTPSVDEAAGALLRLGMAKNAGNIGDLDKFFAISEGTVNNINGVGEALRRASDPKWYDRLGAGIEHFTGTTQSALNQTRLNLEAVDKALSSLSTEQAADAFRRMAMQAKASGVPVEELVNLFPQYRDKVRDAANATGKTVTSNKELADVMMNGVAPASIESAHQLAKVANKAGGVSTEAKQAKKQLQDMVEQMFDAARAALELEGSEDGLEAAIDDATQSVKDNGKTLDNNTEKGRNNRQSLRNIALASLAYREKLIEQGASQKKVTRTTDEARSAFIKTAIKMGATREEAKKLADRFGLVDRKINDLNNKTVKTKVTFSAVGDKFKLHIPNSLSVVKEMGGAKPGPRGIGGPLTVSHSHGVGPESGGPVVHPKIATNRFLDPKKTGDRLQNLIARGLVKKVGTAIGKSDLGLTGPSGSVGAYSADMAGTIAALRRAGARSFTTYPGHHPSMAKARDVTPHSWKIANTAKASRSVWYVIYQMRIASKNHGNTWRAYHPTNYRGDWQHRRHVHVGWYDGGGVMPSGGMAANASGQPERVLSPAQTKSFDQLVKVMDRAGGAAVTQHFHFPNYVGSRDELVRALVDAKRQGRLDVILR